MKVVATKYSSGDETLIRGIREVISEATEPRFNAIDASISGLRTEFQEISKDVSSLKDDVSILKDDVSTILTILKAMPGQPQKPQF